MAIALRPPHLLSPGIVAIFEASSSSTFVHSLCFFLSCSFYRFSRLNVCLTVRNSSFSSCVFREMAIQNGGPKML
jgi:hypothetical protein